MANFQAVGSDSHPPAKSTIEQGEISPAINPEDMYSDTLRESAKYFKETEEGQRKMGKVLDEIRQEGIDMGKEIGKEIGLKCFVRTVKSFVDDFEGVYDAVIKNEEYKDFTREDVMKYYV